MASATRIDGDRFRYVLGHLPTGVTVITGMDGDEPVGMSCNSFTSVSLEPPLVCFGAGKRSETWPRIRGSNRFAVNVLAHGQEEIGRQFARKGIDRFEGVDWRPSSLGNPFIEGALAWIDCEVELEHDVGDHMLVIGRVAELDVFPEEDRKPLVFFRGGYGSFDPPR